MHGFQFSCNFSQCQDIDQCLQIIQHLNFTSSQFYIYKPLLKLLKLKRLMTFKLLVSLQQMITLKICSNNINMLLPERL